MKCNEKGFCGNITSQRKARENGMEDLVMKDMKKAKVFNVFFTLVFSGKACLQEL